MFVLSVCRRNDLFNYFGVKNKMRIFECTSASASARAAPALATLLLVVLDLEMEIISFKIVVFFTVVLLGK